MKVKAENAMTWSRHLQYSALWLGLALCPVLPACAQNCQTSSELDDATRTAIAAAAQRYFDMVSKGDAAWLRQNSIPSLASDFAGIEAAIKERQPELSGAHATVKSLVELESETSASPRTEFYCGVFGKNGQTATSAVFHLDVPPGKYAVVVFEATSPKGRISVSTILQLEGNDWKLGGLYFNPEEIAGHDSDWFPARARDYKAKGQLHNCWFYYLEARSLMSPLAFMSTQATDKLYDEFQSARPADVPGDGKTADLNAGTATYKLTALFPEAVGHDLDLIVKYQVPDASNGNASYQSNIAVIKALVAKYPEVRDAFAAVVARAVDSSNRDYGTLLAIKDIK
jgi:hypothetical protein